MLGLSSACLAASLATGLVELGILAAVGITVLVLAVCMVALPADVECRLWLRPTVTTVGRSASAEVSIEHRGGFPLLLPTVDFAVGGEHVSQAMPWLRRGSRSVRHVEVRADRRGVVPVGPVQLHRQDPLGLMHTVVSSQDETELYVRPSMVPVQSLGAGSQRDLEGIPSSEISMNDLAFHALREYVPGDDLRHVHWRSSARAGELVVRQYRESRRSQATIVLDTARTSYASEEDFELAVSTAASLATGAAAELEDTTVVLGREVVAGSGTNGMLDAFCRVQQDATAVALTGVTAACAAPEAAVILVATGSACGVDDLVALAAAFAPTASIVALRANSGEPVRLGVAAHNVRLVDIGDLGALGGVVRELDVMPA